MLHTPLHMFHRTSAAARPALSVVPSLTSDELSPSAHRHPAMRGLTISTVHGRHCICERCAMLRAA